MKEKNIGGYDVNYKYDRKAVNYVESVLLDSDHIMPHLESGDKLPNLDGYIELCVSAEKKDIPKGRFDVQVKSLNHDYRNDNVRDNTEYLYKYSCDTKVVNVVLEAQTYNPVLLILVDNKDKRIFWKNMSEQYCLELDVGIQANKTIYFNETDEVVDPNEWYDILCDIYKNHSSAQHCAEEARFLLADKEKIIPSIVQDMSDYLNSMLDNELWFIKKVYFPDTWKIGIAYLDGGKNSFSCIGLYKIKREKNDLFIKQFKEDNEYFVSIQYGGKYSLEDIIRQTLENWIEKFFEKDNYFLFLFPDVVLRELFFENIDSEIAKLEMGDEKKEHVTLGWRGTSLSIEEFDNLQSIISKNEVLQFIEQELKYRGINTVYRPWEKIVDYHISKKDEHCIEYEADFDREIVDRKNMKQFLEQFEAFVDECKEMFGERSERVYELKNAYSLVIDDSMEGYTYGVEEANMFSLNVYFKSESEDFYNELKNALRLDSKKYITIGSGLLIRCDYSWYKLWRIFNRNLFLAYIGAKKHNITTDYIASV